MDWVLPGEQDAAQCIPHCSPRNLCGAKFSILYSQNREITMSNKPPSAWAQHFHSPPYTAWLLRGSNPKLLPEFYLCETVLVPWLWQNFLFFCGVVKTQENESQHLAITFSGKEKRIIAAFCVFYLLYDKKKLQADLWVWYWSWATPAFREIW